MFTQTWKKYLPVIGILIKRSANGPQTLQVNGTDFARATGGKKVKFAFLELSINNGRTATLQKQSVVASDLALVLQENMTTRKLMETQHYQFSMSNDFQLTITNINANALSAADENDDTASAEASAETALSDTENTVTNEAGMA